MSGSNSKFMIMKNLLSYIGLVCIPFMVASCVEEVDHVYEDQKVEKVFFTSVEEDSLMTKTIIGQDSVSGQRQLHWLEDDCIGISTGTNAVEKFVNISTESGKSAVFKGTIPSSSLYYAVYPYVDGMKMSSNTFTVNVPAVQPYVTGSFASDVCPMVGKSEGDSKIYFKNLCGVLVINLTGTEKVTSLSFTGEDSSGSPVYISGEHIVDMRYTDVPVLTSTSKSTAQVTVTCDEPVMLDPDTPTAFHFVLPPAEYNSFRLLIGTEDSGVMIKDSKKPLTIKRANITTAGALEFVETVDIDLSEKGNANCYIVSSPGLYSFDASVIGNGEFGILEGAGFHTNTAEIAPESVELLWSTAESVAMDINLNKQTGQVNFYSSGIPGNALIAAKDVNGNILWSWHIWSTEQPVDQQYTGANGTFFVQDRNLGALDSEVGANGNTENCVGLFYQWGRKDPFNHKNYVYDRRAFSVADATLKPTIVQANNFVEYQCTNLDWMTPENALLWLPESKTIYDPCPIGYKVVDRNVLTYADSQAWFPASGYINGRGDYLTADEAYIWASSHRDHYVFADGELTIDNSFGSVVSMPVRCMKDDGEVLADVSILEISNVGSTSASVVGNVTMSGNRVPSGLGFVYGMDQNITIDNSSVVECGEGLGEFSAELTGLSASTKYYVKAYAVVDSKVIYSPAKSFFTADLTGVIDLSINGTANSYIVSYAGNYKFRADVKGNSTESISNPTDVVVIWETLNTSDAVTQGSVISSVSLKDGYVNFSTPEDFTPGNALIAVKSAGKILWSWHIWAVDGDIESSAQLYDTGVLMMDRNLGALTATPGDVRSFGLLYQWGRKDPFVGYGDVANKTAAATYPVDAIQFKDKNANYDNLNYTIAHPDSFIKNSSWNSGDLYWNTSKTMYDPCPVGWRVPDTDVEAWKGFSSISKGIDGGILFSTQMSDIYAYYPYSGYISKDGVLMDVNYQTHIRTANFSMTLRLVDRTVENNYTRSHMSQGLSVRCIKDADFKVKTGDVEDIIKADVYLKVPGVLTVLDSTVMDEVGVVYSKFDNDPKIGDENVVAVGTQNVSSGDFSVTVPGLAPNTKYWIRTYAKGGYNVRYGVVREVYTKASADNEGYGSEDFEW